MAEAKKAVKEFAASLEGDIRIAIRAYGHKGTNQKKDKELSCAGAEELYPLSAYQEERFTQVIDSLKPSGWTPLAAAIRGRARIWRRPIPRTKTSYMWSATGLNPAAATR